MSERERQISNDVTYMWNLKYDADEPIYKMERVTDIENRRVVAKGGVRGCRRNGEGGGVIRCKLLYTEWINSKVLLYITEKYIQYPMINHNRKEDKKGHKCVYIYLYIFIKLNHFAVQQ